MPKMAVLDPAPVLCFGPHLPRRHLQQSEWASTLKSRDYHSVTEALARLLAGRRGSCVLLVSQHYLRTYWVLAQC